MFLQRYSKQDRKNAQSKVDNVALRGSLVAFFMLIPCMILCPIFGYFLPMGSDITKYYITFAITTVVAVLRNPFVAVFTHNVNQKNKRMTATEMKKVNLFKVLDEANERQAKLALTRKPLMETMDGTGNEENKIDEECLI